MVQEEEELVCLKKRASVASRRVVGTDCRATNRDVIEPTKMRKNIEYMTEKLHRSSWYNDNKSK
jgi:hypothetical protein